MNPNGATAANSNQKDPAGPNSNVQNFANSTNISRSTKKEASLAEKIGIDVARREGEKKAAADKIEKHSTSGPLSFKSGEAPDYIKDIVSRETGTPFSEDSDYIIHHPGDKLFYVRRKSNDPAGKNDYLNFTISDDDIVEFRKPTGEHAEVIAMLNNNDTTQAEEISEIQDTNEQPVPFVSEIPSSPASEVAQSTPVPEVKNNERLLLRKNILSRIAEQYRTEEDKQELAAIEKTLQGNTPSIATPLSPTPSIGTLGTIGMSQKTVPESSPIISTIAGTEVKPTEPVSIFSEPTAPIVAVESAQPEVVALENVSGTENISPESADESAPIKTMEESLMSQAKSLLEVHDLLEKNNGLITGMGTIGYDEAWNKTKQFMSGEITKAELPDNTDFINKLVELKTIRDNELHLLGATIAPAGSPEEIKKPETIDGEQEDVTDIIKPRHVILGSQIEITDDNDEATGGMSDSERERFEKMFGGVKQPAKKIELNSMSVPFSAPESTGIPMEAPTVVEKKINRAELAKKFQESLRKSFGIRPLGSVLQPVTNESMIAIGKKEPEALFS